MPLENCKRCNRVFARHLSPLCADCLTQEQQLGTAVYRFVQSNPGTSMDEIATHFQMSLKEIEALVFSGALGTANQLIMTKCARCKCEMTFVNRVGYFCYLCNQFMEKESGRLPEDKKKIQQILDRPRTSTLQEHSELAKIPAKNAMPSKNTGHRKLVAKYGFKRVSGQSPLQ